jgi:hypothetical protein
MSRLPRTIVVAALLAVPATAAAQVDLRPAPPPTITAESATWYQNREPMLVGGIVYYPAGPQVFFNSQEMVRSGLYRGVPIYTRTTAEPYSQLFVPLTGGLMQPYERRRSGELAGTVGTSTPSFPVDRYPDEKSGLGPDVPQAAGPPTGVAAVEEPVGTSGRVGGEAAPDRQRPSPRRNAPNAIYIEYNGARWFSKGPPVEMDDRFVIAGRYFGMPVYVNRQDVTGRIYVPVTGASEALLAPYSRD